MNGANLKVAICRRILKCSYTHTSNGQIQSVQ